MANSKHRNWVPGGLIVGVLLALALGPAACSDDDGSSGAPSTDADSDADSDADADSDSDSDSDIDPMGDAFIRVAHLSPDAPAVDIWVGGEIAIEGLAFAESSGYLAVPAGTYTFDVTASGDTNVVLSLEDVELIEGGSYTAAAFGELASIQGAALMDDYDDLESGDIRVRAFHAADGVGQVDIWSLPEDGDPAQLYDDVPFAALGDYLDVPAGAYSLGFDVNEDAAPDLIFDLPALDSGAVANLFAVNDGGAVSIVAQLDGSTTAQIPAGATQIRVLHLSPDAPPVDVYANDGDSPVASGLGFGSSTDYLDIAAAGYDFYVTAEGAPKSDSVLDIMGVLLRPERSYTVVAFDSVSEIQPLLIEDDYSEVSEGQIRVRPIHAAASVGQVDIWDVTGDPAMLYEDFDFGAVGAYLDLPADAYSLGFDVDNDMVPDLTFDLPALEVGNVVNIFAVNDGGVYLIAQLDDGSTVPIDPAS